MLSSLENLNKVDMRCNRLSPLLADMKRLSPEGVDTRQCFSKDAGPREREWIRESHIDWRRERVPARMLGLAGR